MSKVHYFRGTEEAYNASQTDETISDGDILFCSNGVVGFLMEAWPVAVTAKSGEFHTIADDKDNYVFSRTLGGEPRDYGSEARQAKLLAGIAGFAL